MDGTITKDTTERKMDVDSKPLSVLLCTMNDPSATIAVMLQTASKSVLDTSWVSNVPYTQRHDVFHMIASYQALMKRYEEEQAAMNEVISTHPTLLPLLQMNFSQLAQWQATFADLRESKEAAETLEALTAFIHRYLPIFERILALSSRLVKLSCSIHQVMMQAQAAVIETRMRQLRTAARFGIPLEDIIAAEAIESNTYAQETLNENPSFIEHVDVNMGSDDPDETHGSYPVFMGRDKSLTTKRSVLKPKDWYDGTM